ncbi:hypothetical protein BASA81_000669 [Batrachochytrium salamandrivorans]|nr:hypothetical protein BASA81_000669 [Batrachochytrium salamandrivorans]
MNPPSAKQARMSISSVEPVWHRLIVAHAQERPTRELLGIRAELLKLAPKQHLQSMLAEQLARDFAHLPPGTKLSHLLFAALDFDLGRLALGEVDYKAMVFPQLVQSISELMEFLFTPGREMSAVYLEWLRDLDRTLECVSRLNVAQHTAFPVELVLQLQQILLEFSHSKHGVKFLRTAALALAHINGKLPSNGTSRIVQSAWLFATISLNKTEWEENCKLLANISTLTSSYSLEEEQDVDTVMLALEALCAWSGRLALTANKLDVSLAFDLCVQFADHITLATLGLNTYERLVVACVKLEWQDMLQCEVENLVHAQLALTKQCGRGFYLRLEKFIKAVGALKTVAWSGNGNLSLVQRLLAKKSHQEVVGNGICNCLCALFKSWLVETKYMVTEEIKQEFAHVANELKNGAGDVFVNFHLVRRFLNDFFSEFQCAAEARANKEIGLFLLAKLPVGETNAWARLSLLLALERGAIHVTVVVGPVRGLQLGLHELEQALCSADVELRQASWALVSTRVKKTRFPPKVVLDAVLRAFRVMVKFDCNAVKTSLERLFDRVFLLLKHKPKVNPTAASVHDNGDDNEDMDIDLGKAYCRAFLRECTGVIANQLYVDAPLNAVSLSLDLAAHLLQNNGTALGLLDSLLFPGTIKVLLHMLLHSSFDSMRGQAYKVLELMPATLPGMETCELMTKYLIDVLPTLRTKSRRECDAIALLYRLFLNRFREVGAFLHFAPQSEDAIVMRQALQLAKQCKTVTTAYDVGCIITSMEGATLATGFSRELEGNTHAEEVALSRLLLSTTREGELTLYTTMEPCSHRLSGKECCTARILAYNDSNPCNKIARVVVGVNEPDLFVKDCVGVSLLNQHGIAITRVDLTVAQECLATSTGGRWGPTEVFVSELAAQLLQTNNNSSPVLALITLRYVLRDCKELPQTQHDLLPLLLQCVDRAAKQMVETSTQGEDDAEDAEEEDAAWLVVREGSEALTELLERTALIPEREHNHAVVVLACNWFLDTALQLKHSGAMTYVTKGLERVTKLLLKSTALQHVVIKQWLPRLFEQLRNEQEFDKAIRRNEGFCFAIRAIVRASELCKRGDVIQLVCHQLIVLEQHKQAAHLNVLKSLFEDSVSARALGPFLAQSIQLAVDGFPSPEWKIRSASLSLMVSLLKRIVGDQPSKTCVSVNSFRAVFSSYPSLVQVLDRELSLAVHSPSSTQLALYPLLLFLSSMKLSTESATSKEELRFAELCQQLCQQHPVFQVRAIAARAWAVLQPTPNTFPISAATQNNLHGTLLYLRDTGNAKAFTNNVGEILVDGNNSYIVRELALELAAEPSFDWLLTTVGEYMELAPDQADGDLLGRTRFYTKLLIKFVDTAVASNQFSQLERVLCELMNKGVAGLGAFQRLAELALLNHEALPRLLAGLIPVLLAQCCESEHVEALAALLPTERMGTAANVDHLVQVLTALPRNVRLQAAGLRVLSKLGSKQEFVPRLQLATKHAALEMRLASALCVGDNKRDEELLRLVCALQLLCDEDEQVREVTRSSLGGRDCVGATFHTLWSKITQTLAAAASSSWLDYLLEWVFTSSPHRNGEEEEDGQPLEHFEQKLWVDLASQELARVVRQRQVAGLLSEQQARELASCALARLLSSSSSASFIDQYSALWNPTLGLSCCGK